MTTNPSTLPSKFAGRCAMGAAAAMAVAAVLQLTDEQSSESTTVGIEHVGLAAFTVSVLLLIPMVLGLARAAGLPRLGLATAVGMGALGLTTIVSNINGEDPSFFPAIAGPANLLWFGTLIACAVRLRRNGILSRPLAIMLPLTMVFFLPLSAVGGTLVAGAYWFTLGWLADNDQLPRAAGRAAPQPAAA
jgi:hypothetical protein